MALGFSGVVARWLRSKRPSDEQCVAAACRRQRNSKRVRLTQLVPFGSPIVLLLLMVWWIHYLKRHMDWEAEASTFWLGFCTGGLCGLGFCVLVTVFFVTLGEVAGDKRHELMLRFHDELEKVDK